MNYYEDKSSCNEGRLYSETDLRRIFRFQPRTATKQTYSQWVEQSLQDGTLVEVESLVDLDGEYNTLVINLFGAPSSGKSTLAHRLVADLSMSGYLSEYVPEYAKELIYDDKRERLDGKVENQRIVSNEQKHRIERLLGKVEVVVTDSPALLGKFYAKHDGKGYKEFCADLEEWHRAQNAINVFVNSSRLPYDKRGRKHTEEEAVKIQEAIMDEVICTYTFSHNTLQPDSFASLSEAIKTRVDAIRRTKIFA